VLSSTRKILGLRLLCLAVVAVAGLSRCPAQIAKPEPLFDFHSGFWINLHHFLYLQAVAPGAQHGPHPLSLTATDSDELQHLSQPELATWNESVSIYRTSYAKRDLLFDDELIEAKSELEDNEDSPDLAGAKISPQLREALLKASPIYRKHWWPRHDAGNRKWISDLTPLIDRHGAYLAADLARIYAEPWPGNPVRVDAVAYANWAGAYTTLYPTRPAISTNDAANQGPAALEIVFHETSHGMMDAVREGIDGAERDVNAHRTGAPFHSGSIWHAVLFYTAGKLVAGRIPGYLPYADANGLWKRAWADPDRSLIERDWAPHIAGSADLQHALATLVTDLAATAPHN
jgi:hypothetical protein